MFNRQIPTVVQEFIGGLWLDGYIRQDGMVAICLASQTLISQLQVVMNNFGLRARINQKWNAEYERSYPELEMHGEDGTSSPENAVLDGDPTQTHDTVGWPTSVARHCPAAASRRTEVMPSAASRRNPSATTTTARAGRDAPGGT